MVVLPPPMYKATAFTASMKYLRAVSHLFWKKSSHRLSSKTVEIKPFTTYIRVSQTLRVPISAD